MVLKNHPLLYTCTETLVQLLLLPIVHFITLLPTLCLVLRAISLSLPLLITPSD